MISFSENCLRTCVVDFVRHVVPRDQRDGFSPGQRRAFALAENRGFAPCIEKMHAFIGFADLACFARMHGQAISAAVDLRRADLDELAQFRIESGLVDIPLQGTRCLKGGWNSL